MATEPVLQFIDGRLEIPENLRQEWHLDEGSEVHVVYAADGRVLLETQLLFESSKPDWRRLEGALAHLSSSPNIDLEEERLRELELDARP